MAKKNKGLTDKIVLFIKENLSTIILPIIAILVLSSGIYFYSKSKAKLPIEEVLEQATTTEEAPTTTEEISKETEKLPEKEVSEQKAILGGPEDQNLRKPEKTDNIYILKAKRGEGITHLARYALKEYLLQDQEGKQFKEKLTPEHKIYIEDYIKDRIGSRLLNIGEEITISKSLIKEAIQSSLNLSSSQLQNLKKFSQKVLSFNLNY